MAQWFLFTLVVVTTLFCNFTSVKGLKWESNISTNLEPVSRNAVTEARKATKQIPPSSKWTIKRLFRNLDLIQLGAFMCRTLKEKLFIRMQFGDKLMRFIFD